MNQELRQQIIKEYNQRFPKKDFIPGESPVPVSGKIFDEQEMLGGVEAVLDGWWTEGRFSDEFEIAFKDFLGIKYVALVNSGSSANLLALAALTSKKMGDRRLKPGDEVITAAAGFPTTVNPIIQLGMVPVFVDLELGSYNATATAVAAAIGPKTRAIFLAHTLGNPFDLSAIKDLCQKNNLWLLEDNCDALGSQHEGQYTGTFGDVATGSFYPAHHMTMGEAGAVITNDPVINRVVRSLRDWGRDCWCKTGHDDSCSRRFAWQLGNLPYGYDHKYIYSELGYNLKTTDLQAAIGLAQLKKLPDFITRRKENFQILYDLLKEFAEYFILPASAPEADPAWFGFLLTVKTDAPFQRDDLLRFLNKKKVGTRLLFAGNITKQPYFTDNDFNYRVAENLVNTDLIMTNTFWLGVYPGLTREMLIYMRDCLREFIHTL